MLFLRLYLLLYLWFCLSEHSAALITCCLFILQLSLFFDVPRSHFSWNQGMGLGTGGRVIMYYRLLLLRMGDYQYQVDYYFFSFGLFRISFYLTLTDVPHQLPLYRFLKVD
jgi:hypothetical protein